MRNKATTSNSILIPNIAAAILLWLPGCASVRTVEAPVGSPNTGRSYAGLHYFLPKGVIDITGAPDEEGGLYEITIARRNEADRDGRYRLVIGKNVLFDDAVKFHVDADGLLDQVIDATGDSKVADIVDALADTAINLGKIYLKVYGEPGTTTSGFTTTDGKTRTLKPFKVSFDPYEDREIKTAATKMDDAGFTLKSESYSRKKLVKETSRKNSDSRISGHLSHLGVFYRPLTTVKISVECQGDASIALHRNVPVPDRESLAVYSISRGAFVKRENKVTFRNGEPVDVNYKYPSDALAFTKVPLNLTTKALAALDAVPSLAQFIYRPQPPPKDPNADIKAQTARSKAEEERYIARQELYAQQKKTAEERQKAVDAVSKSKGASKLSSPSNTKPTVPKTGNTFDETQQRQVDDGLGLPALEVEVGNVKKGVTELQNEVTGIKVDVKDIKRKTDKLPAE